MWGECYRKQDEEECRESDAQFTGRSASPHSSPFRSAAVAQGLPTSDPALYPEVRPTLLLRRTHRALASANLHARKPVLQSQGVRAPVLQGLPKRHKNWGCPADALTPPPRGRRRIEARHRKGAPPAERLVAGAAPVRSPEVHQGPAPKPWTDSVAGGARGQVPSTALTRWSSCRARAHVRACGVQTAAMLADDYPGVRL